MKLDKLKKYLSSELGISFLSDEEEEFLEEIKSSKDPQYIWNEALSFYFSTDGVFPASFSNYLFKSKDGAKIVFEFFEVQCGYDTVTVDIEKIKRFVQKLQSDKLLLIFLKQISEVFNNILDINPRFSDYERILKYSLLLTWPLKTNKLSETYFENFLFVLRKAGEQGRLGYAFKGHRVLKEFAQYMPGHLVSYIVKRKNICFSDEEERSPGYRVTEPQIDWLIEYSSLTDKQKKSCRFISKYYYNLHVELQKAAKIKILEMLFQYNIVYDDQVLQRDGDILQVIQDKRGNRKFLRYEKSVADIRWRFSLLDHKGQCIWKWELWYKLLDSPDHFLLNVDEWDTISGLKHEELSYSFQESSWELTRRVSDLLYKGYYLGTEVVGIWHESLYHGRIPERYLNFTRDVSIEKKEENRFEFKSCVDGKKTSFFYLNRESYGNISSISAMVGKNGSGKTSAFRLLCYDESLKKDKDAVGKYIIFYRMQGMYYYSTNIPEDELQMEGIGKEFNMTEDRGKRAAVVYFTNLLSLYQNTEEKNESDFIDISNHAIWEQEVSQQKASKKYLDVIRRLRFLDDLYQAFKSESEKMKDIQHDFRINTIRLRIPNPIVEKINGWDSEKIKSLTGKDIVISGIEEIHEIYQLCIAALQAAKTYEEEATQQNVPEVEQEFLIAIPNLSSGQQAKFELYSRLHSLFLAKQETRDRITDPLHVNSFQGAIADNYILLLDEIESYLHPEWQRCFIYEFIRFLEWENRNRVYENIQIVLSSNSPFFMSDLPSGNICVLYRDEKEVPGDQVRIENLLEKGTFAQNIHRIMKSSFFMDEGLMGKFARHKLDWAFERLEQEKLSDFEKEEIQYITEHTGEPLLKNALMDLYMDRYPSKEWDDKRKQFFDILRNLSEEERTRLLMEMEREESS